MDSQLTTAAQSDIFSGNSFAQNKVLLLTPFLAGEKLLTSKLADFFPEYQGDNSYAGAS